MVAVLFDLDGTLHDRATGLRRFAKNQAVRLKIPPADQDRFVQRFSELDAGGSVGKDRVYAHLRDEFGSAHWPSINALVDDYVDGFAAFAVETPGASELLLSLKQRGIRVAIVTNGRSDLQRAVIAALGSLEAMAREAVMVGDHPTADMEGAVGAGIHPIAFRCKPAHPVPTAETMQDVEREILKRVCNAA